MKSVDRRCRKIINRSQKVSFSRPIPLGGPPKWSLCVGNTGLCFSVCSAHQRKCDDVSVFSLLMGPNDMIIYHLSAPLCSSLTQDHFCPSLAIKSRCYSFSCLSPFQILKHKTFRAWGCFVNPRPSHPSCPAQSHILPSSGQPVKVFLARCSGLPLRFTAGFHLETRGRRW